jgi:hypothetical protein
LVIIGAGIALVWIGATGDTEITLFGNTFKSQTVAAVGIFCGNIKSLEQLGRLPPEPNVDIEALLTKMQELEDKKKST